MPDVSLSGFTRLRRCSSGSKVGAISSTVVSSYHLVSWNEGKYLWVSFSHIWVEATLFEIQHLNTSDYLHSSHIRSEIMTDDVRGGRLSLLLWIKLRRCNCFLEANHTVGNNLDPKLSNILQVWKERQNSSSSKPLWWNMLVPGLSLCRDHRFIM